MKRGLLRFVTVPPSSPYREPARELASVPSMLEALGGGDAMTRLCGLLDCARVFIGPGTWTSPCGSTRLRAEHGSRELRVERLAPDGLTERCHRLALRIPLGLDPAPARVTEVRRAETLGRVLRPVCFFGAPSDPRRHEPRSVELLMREEDVLLRRLDARGRDIGDTRHPTEAAAHRQLRFELGAHVGPLRSVQELARIDRRPAD